jgi:SAM-dependent methyltransferase
VALAFDPELLAKMEVLYRTRDVVRRRRLVREALRPAPGERIVDIGCGPGFYVSELAHEVGEAGAVVGVDSSGTMLGAARARCRELGNVELLEADASSLPLAGGSFDAALSVQVLEYVADIQAALAEVRRVLRPGGRLVVWDVDWATVSMQTADEVRMTRVLKAWDGHLAHPSLPRSISPLLLGSGFEDVRVEGHAFVATTFDPEAYGVNALPLMEDHVAGSPAVGPDLAHAWADEQRELGAQGAFYFACVQCCATAQRRF